MPENTNPGDGGQGAGGEAAGKGAGEATTTVTKTVTMTQDEMDRIIADRVARAKPKDYDDLVALKQRTEADEQAKKDELTRAKDEAKKANEERDAAISGANQTLIRAAIIAEAAAQDAVDADAVAVFLAGDDSITIEGGKVKGAKPAVKKLLEDRPYLAKPKGGASGGEFGGTDQPTLQERIKEAESKGDWPTARRLKLELSQKSR